MSGFRVTTTAEVAMELGAYGDERQQEVRQALDELADAFSPVPGPSSATPAGAGGQAELMPGVVFSWVVVPHARLVIVWQATAR
jgi:hypothetical protein